MDFHPQNQATYQLGVALSGGGAKGIAHIGVLKALCEKGICPDIISGTSAGAVVGAFFAAGVAPEKIIRLLVRENLKDFLGISFNGKSFLRYDGFARFLDKHLPVKRFEDLKIPLHVVASNFDSGEYEVFTEGELIPRILASCTIPIIFSPIEIEGKHYVDGGLFMNLPVTPLRPLCKTIIGVNVSPFLIDDKKDNIIHIAAKSFQYIFNANSSVDRKLCDLLVEVNDMESFNLFDLGSAREIYHIGYRRMRKLLNY